MAYKPQVISADIVSHNKKNGLVEIVANLDDRSVCRVTYENVNGEHKPSNISRLLVQPCPICKKDFLCKCMDRYLEPIANQAIAITGAPTA